MESKKSVHDLAAMYHTDIRGLAELAGVDPAHLESVASGKAEMTAEELIRLSKLTGLDPEAIAFQHQ